MRRAAAAFVVIGLVTVPVAAQGPGGRYGDRAQGVPPGHLPPPGECRVWYDDRPAGHQPAPTNCHNAERVAARDRYARVIYGGSARRDDDRWDRNDDRRDRDRPRAIPRRDSGYPYPDRYPPESRYPYPDRYPSDRGDRYSSVPFDNGYRDGYDKGREDARDNDPYDPVRHSRYRSGDRGHDRRYGSKEAYRNVYRDGFRAGYEEGYREANGYGRDRRPNGVRLPWPF